MVAVWRVWVMRWWNYNHQNIQLTPHLLCKFAFLLFLSEFWDIFRWDFCGFVAAVNGMKGHRTCGHILIWFLVRGEINNDDSVLCLKNVLAYMPNENYFITNYIYREKFWRYQLFDSYTLLTGLSFFQFNFSLLTISRTLIFKNECSQFKSNVLEYSSLCRYI